EGSLLLLRALVRQLHALVHASRGRRRAERARRSEGRRPHGVRPEDARGDAEEDRDRNTGDEVVSSMKLCVVAVAFALGCSVPEREAISPSSSEAPRVVVEASEGAPTSYV